MAEVDGNVRGRRVAVLATHGVEASELVRPVEALREAGAEVEIVSISRSSDRIKAWDETDWGDSIEVDATVEERSAGDYDALMLPGGVMNPDKLRMDEGAVRFVRGFVESEKPVAAICHAPWVLVEADVVRGRRLTSYPSLETDLRNAGAEWVDEEVVVDHGLVTSRSPADLDPFISKMLEEIGEGVHAPRG